MWDLFYEADSESKVGHRFSTFPDTMTANHCIEIDTRLGKALRAQLV